MLQHSAHHVAAIQFLLSSCALRAAGRMGDTFPHTFTCQDQRLRSGAKYSVLVQELGRLCRYPTVHNSQKLPKLSSALSQTGESSRLYLLEQALHKAYGTEHWQGMSVGVAHDTILYLRVCKCNVLVFAARLIVGCCRGAKVCMDHSSQHHCSSVQQ